MSNPVSPRRIYFSWSVLRYPVFGGFGGMNCRRHVGPSSHPMCDDGTHDYQHLPFESSSTLARLCIDSNQVNYVGPCRLADRRLGIFSEEMADEERPLITAAQISAHNTPSDCWVVIDNRVWDMTDFAPEHPGGADSTVPYPFTSFRPQALEAP